MKRSNRKISLLQALVIACVMAGSGAIFEAAADCVPWIPGVAGWWAGEGSAHDQAATNNGVLVGGTSFVPGEVGQAFSFDGTSGYVKIPRSPSLDVGAQFTMECWMMAASDN